MMTAKGSFNSVYEARTGKSVRGGADTDALTEMSLIWGYELRMQGRDGGRVTVEPLP